MRTHSNAFSRVMSFFEYPIDAGVMTAAPETPFSRLQPNSITLSQLGDGAAAVALLLEVQLL